MVDENDYDLVPTHLAVEAMRDNGYRNTAYAIAELIDNAIQADATAVELLCCETEEFVQQRSRRRIKEIAVLDNGTGMDTATLRLALQFGNGTHLDDRSGIGRFGMGLPSASISQCRRVDVWSWRGGADNALHSYVDLREVAKGQRTVPVPQPAPLPDLWVHAANEIGGSGTLVVWSALDRCMWRTATTILRNSEFVIARMYRRFLSEGRASIRLASFTETDSGYFTNDSQAVANDPGYLIMPSSTPAPYDETAMFQPDGDSWEISQRIEFRGSEHTVTIRFSFAKEEVRNHPKAGSTDYGKHAGRNIGVSLVRAARELDMDDALVINYDPRERWWGVEVEFPPALDELFGVTNNKQSARNFTEVAANFKSILVGAGGTTQEVIDELIEEEDPSGPLIDIVNLIDRRLRVLRKGIEVQRKGAGKSRRKFDPTTPEAQATAVTRERQQEGYRGASDEGEQLPPEERTEELKNELIEVGLSEEQAEDLAARTIASGIKYTFAEANLEGRSFFTVRPVAGEIVIKINVNHPAYQNLVEVLEEDEVGEAVTEDELRNRLARASRGLKLLLMAWARFEDEQPTEQRREEIQDIRSDWGRVAYRFLNEE
ncbi:MAG TPA: ATP-binding protein [Frankiaceae bacterium]|nr:ATP-binding protein [Frankiaceae bacterium]